MIEEDITLMVVECLYEFCIRYKNSSYLRAKKCNTIFRVLKFVFVISFMSEENVFLWSQFKTINITYRALMKVTRTCLFQILLTELWCWYIVSFGDTRNSLPI